jgi:hypothetical protein
MSTHTARAAMNTAAWYCSYCEHAYDEHEYTQKIQFLGLVHFDTISLQEKFGLPRSFLVPSR